jgi:hypothetical protein
MLGHLALLGDLPFLPPSLLMCSRRYKCDLVYVRAAASSEEHYILTDGIFWGGGGEYDGGPSYA